MKITTRSFAKTLFSLINENKKLLIGLSGGMDSVVLLDLCEKIIPSGKLFAIHINHGLTKESDNHEKFVYKICIDKNIPLILKAEKRTIKRNERRIIAVGSGFESKNSRSKESLKLLKKIPPIDEFTKKKTSEFYKFLR